MPTLLQINITANWGSTGKIAESIGLTAMKHGWKSYIAYGRWSNPSKSQLIKIGGRWDKYFHFAEQCILDNEGLCSRTATKKLIRQIKEIKPNLAIPIHYKTIVGSDEDAYKFKQLLEEVVHVEILY